MRGGRRTSARRCSAAEPPCGGRARILRSVVADACEAERWSWRARHTMRLHSTATGWWHSLQLSWLTLMKQTPSPLSAGLRDASPYPLDCLGLHWARIVEHVLSAV